MRPCGLRFFHHRRGIATHVVVGKCAAAVVPNEDLQAHFSRKELRNIMAIGYLMLLRDAGNYFSNRFRWLYA